MKRRLKSDKNFFDFFLSGRGAKGALILLFVGLCLILISSSLAGEGSNKSIEASTNEEMLEQRVASLCSSIEGVGDCRVMITYDQERVCAVAVLCEGAGSDRVRSEISTALSRLFGIGQNRISVLKIAK